MKKGMIAVLFTALMLLQASIAFANVSSYVDPYSMTSESSVARTNATITGMRVVSMPVRSVCKLGITVSPRDNYFLGRQRNICVQQNKGNLYCQQQCIEKMKLFITQGAYERGLGLYSVAGCAAADKEAVKTAGSASRCYFVASDECASVNPTNDFCRRKCIQSAYAVCRQNIAAMRYH